ncbi:hypothetical protein Tco_1377960 [Tanacetum coccineum]
MAESSSQKTSSPEIIPKKNPSLLTNLKAQTLSYLQVMLILPLMRSLSPPTMRLHSSKTLDDSKVWISSPTGGIRGDIGITTFRKALRAQYLPHSSMYVPPPSITTMRPWFTAIGYKGEIGEKGTLKKSCLPPRWRLMMAQIMQCLGGKTGGLDQISNKDATILYCLANGVKVDYAKIIWEDLIHKLNKKTREKIVPYPSVHNLTLKPKQPEEPPFTDHMKAICNLDVHVDSKTPKPSSQTEEAQQAAGGLTSLGATSEEGAHPQLSSGSNPSVLVDKTKSAGDGLKTAHTDSGANKESRADDISLKSEEEEKEEVARDKDTGATSYDVPKGTSVPPPPSLKSAQIQELMAQVHLLQSQKEELEQAKAKAKAEVALMKAKPLYLDINQLTELPVPSLKPEISKLLASHDFASCLPTKLKDLP